MKQEKQKYMSHEEIARYVAARQEQESAKHKERVITLAVRILKKLGRGNFTVHGEYVKVVIWIRREPNMKALQSALKEYGYFLTSYDNDILLGFRYVLTLSLDKKAADYDPYSTTQHAPGHDF